MSGKSTAGASAVSLTAVSHTAVSQRAVSQTAVSQTAVSRTPVSDGSARWAALDSRHERLVTASDALLANVGHKDDRRMAS